MPLFGFALAEMATGGNSAIALLGTVEWMLPCVGAAMGVVRSETDADGVAFAAPDPEVEVEEVDGPVCAPLHALIAAHITTTAAAAK
jgi:hypothetical protein